MLNFLTGNYMVRRRTIFTVLSHFALLISLIFMILALFAQQPLCDGVPEGTFIMKDVFCAKDYYVKIVGVGLAIFTTFDVIEAIVCQCMILRATKSIFHLFAGWLSITVLWVLIYCTFGSVYILLQPDTVWNTTVTITTILSATSLMSMLAVIRFQRQLNKILQKQHWEKVFPSKIRNFNPDVHCSVKLHSIKVGKQNEEYKMEKDEKDSKPPLLEMDCESPV